MKLGLYNNTNGFEDANNLSSLIETGIIAYNENDFDKAMNMALEIDQQLYESRINMLNLKENKIYELKTLNSRKFRFSFRNGISIRFKLK